MTFLVTGSGGMLGQDVLATLVSRGVPAVGLDRASLDITSAAEVKLALESSGATVVVNCAAYTKVDDAETHESDALLVNGTGASVLADACASTGVRLLQVSTDYVFPGDASAPYAEDAPTGPRTAYGRTKLAGETAVLASGGVVVRTAWLYGAHGPNFVRTMLSLESSRETLDVVDDQQGQPTWTADVASLLVSLGLHDGELSGVFHATSSGATTWCGFAQDVFRLAGADPARVRPTTTDKFPRPAPRPAYSVLGHDRWSTVGIEPIADWRSRLATAFPSVASS